ncbi:MAG: helix-turn-helix domain-containing protein [Acidimicrobiia bacterium]
MTAPSVPHRVIEAVRPAVEATGSSIIGVDEADQMDVPIEWDGDVIAYARIGSLADALGILVGRIEDELGASLQDLDRSEKQTAIRLLDARGAFQLRKSIEDVADLMEVSRITIYNYLNAIRA